MNAGQRRGYVLLQQPRRNKTNTMRKQFMMKTHVSKCHQCGLFSLQRNSGEWLVERLEVFEWSLATAKHFKCSPSNSHHPQPHTPLHVYTYTQTHRCQRGLSDSTLVTGCLLWKQHPSSPLPSSLFLWTLAWHTRPCSLVHIFTHRY